MKSRPQRKSRLAVQLPTFSSSPSPSSASSHPKRKQSEKQSGTRYRGLTGDQRTQKLVERLHHIVVYELVKGGKGDDDNPPPIMRNMRLRDLYNYIQDRVCDGDDSVEDERTHKKTTTNISDIVSVADVTRDVEKRQKIFNRRRASSFAGTPAKLPVPPDDSIANTTPQKKLQPTIPLGGYLHPRDMRRMVTPFSASNEPALIVRRHVMLLNFDPFRAIVLRDRLLFLVPDGADGILTSLEKRVRGGVAEAENEVFGESGDGSTDSRGESDNNADIKNSSAEIYDDDDDTGDNSDSDDSRSSSQSNEEDMSFELVCLDAVIQSVAQALRQDFDGLNKRVHDVMEVLRGVGRARGSQRGRQINNMKSNSQEQLRIVKNQISLLDGRVRGFVRAINVVLDDDEDLALCNLSKLISHRTMFIQPVDRQLLEEMGDEPELILEAYSQQGLSTANSIEILRANVTSTEELIRMKLDTIRNRLLMYNTVLAVLSLCVTSASLVGSFFGMNLMNKWEESDSAFVNVVIVTLASATFIALTIFWVFNIFGSAS